MKWIVQEFLNKNENVERMKKALEQEKSPFLFVRINADNSLTVLDKKTRLPLEDSEVILTSFLAEGDITGYGSKTLSLILESLSISPGSFLNPRFEMEVIRDAIGEELLNSSFSIGELQELNPSWESFFIRPTGNTKLFTGMCLSKADFLQWKERENRPGSPYEGQLLMISEKKLIQEEYRFFVINGEVITGSSYQINGEANQSFIPTSEVWEYAKRMVNRFDLATAFVIDVGKTSEGMKVIEYNNFNTSGLYQCDEVMIVRAMENYKR